MLENSGAVTPLTHVNVIYTLGLTIIMNATLTIPSYWRRGGELIIFITRAQIRAEPVRSAGERFLRALHNARVQEGPQALTVSC